MQKKSFTLYDEENRPVQDAYAMLMTNVLFRRAREPVQSLTVTSCVPQVGKTTTSINLAISMARVGWKTLMVDADLRKPGACKRLSNETLLGLSDLIDETVSFNDALCTTNIPNLDYMACGRVRQNPIEQLCSANFERFMEEAKRHYDCLIFDTPALLSVVDGALVAAQTDGAVMIAKIGATGLDTMNRAKEQLEAANANLVGVVMNQVAKREYVKYVAGYNYFKRFNKQKKAAAKGKKAVAVAGL